VFDPAIDPIIFPDATKEVVAFVNKTVLEVAFPLLTTWARFDAVLTPVNKEPFPEKYVAEMLPFTVNTFDPPSVTNKLLPTVRVLAEYKALPMEQLPCMMAPFEMRLPVNND
jgi:hypothetical protein